MIFYFFWRNLEKARMVQLSVLKERGTWIEYRDFSLQTLKHLVWNACVFVSIVWMGRLRLWGVMWFVQSNSIADPGIYLYITAVNLPSPILTCTLGIEAETIAEIFSSSTSLCSFLLNALSWGHSWAWRTAGIKCVVIFLKQVRSGSVRNHSYSAFAIEAQ